MISASALLRPRAVRLRRSIAAPSIVLLAMLAAEPAVAGAAGWTVQPTPPEPAILNGVSCPAPTACTAVGGAGGDGLSVADQWDGSLWTASPTPAPAASHLSAVSCTSRTACTAVGGYLSADSAGPAEAAWIDRWNGLGWVIQPTPALSGASSLLGVSCTSGSACTAVGLAGNGPLVERWNGTRWAVQSAPAPSGAVSVELRAVSCAGPKACVAVGSYRTSTSGDLTLAESWDGASWTIQPLPAPSSGSLEAVSCSSASACTAVGNYDTGYLFSLAEVWNGTSWTVQPTPNAVSNGYNRLEGVSCTSASACMAVGDSGRPGATGPSNLAERWDGTAWTIQAPPSPPNTDGSQLQGVSCSSASACTAVGVTYPSGGVTTNQTLAERYG